MSTLATLAKENFALEGSRPVGHVERTTEEDLVIRTAKDRNMITELSGPGQGTSTASKMDLMCHHVEAIRQEQTTRETSQSMGRRPGQILERHDLEKDSTRQGNLETAC